MNISVSNIQSYGGYLTTSLAIHKRCKNILVSQISNQATENLNQGSKKCIKGKQVKGKESSIFLPAFVYFLFFYFLPST